MIDPTSSIPTGNATVSSPIVDNYQTTAPTTRSRKPLAFLIIILLLVTSAMLYLPVFLEMQTTPTPTPQPNVDRIMNNGRIVIGTDATYPPMESYDETGNLEGYDIDLAEKITEKLGVTARIENTPWDTIFDRLQDGTIDIIISAVTINADREALYAFSLPYLNAGQVIITQKSNSTITSTQDLSGKKIAVQTATTNAEEALKYTDPSLVLLYPDYEQATQALVTGEADAIFSDLTNAKGIVQEFPTLKIASAPFTNDYYGIVMRKDELDLVNKINEVLNSLRQEGYLVFLQRQWLE